jgi:hypothetical protein
LGNPSFLRFEGAGENAGVFG